MRRAGLRPEQRAKAPRVLNPHLIIKKKSMKQMIDREKVRANIGREGLTYLVTNCKEHQPHVGTIDGNREKGETKIEKVRIEYITKKINLITD